MALGKKQEVTTCSTPGGMEKRFTESRKSAMEKALAAEKVRYESNCNSEKFKEFLEDRLTIWDDLKDKTFHGKRMHEKTKSLIDNWN